MKQNLSLEGRVQGRAITGALRINQMVLAFLLITLCSCSPRRSSNPPEEEGAHSQTSETILSCDYPLADIGVTYREIYALDIAGKIGRIVSSVGSPAGPPRTGSAIARDNAYEIAFPELKVSGTPIEGSALRIQINRYSGDSERIQVDRSGNGSATHRGHCARFDGKSKL
jgi:hypothetical protein